MTRHMLRICFLASVASAGSSGESLEVGALGPHLSLRLQKGPSGWGIVLIEDSWTYATQRDPAIIEYSQDQLHLSRAAAGYDTVQRTAAGFDGQARVPVFSGVSILVRDEWRIEGAVLSLRRKTEVHGSARGGFMSAFTLAWESARSRSTARLFAPGMMYGEPSHLSPSAIGGSYTQGKGEVEVRIREDRLPGPLFGAYWDKGVHCAVLDPSPAGDTFAEEARDTAFVTFTDGRVKFNAMGARLHASSMEIGAWYPGSEGQVTYKGNTYPGGQEQAWRLRLHPLDDGFIQEYSLSLRFSSESSFSDFMTDAWRWAWTVLAPKVNRQDIEVVRRTMSQALGEQVELLGDRAGIPNFVNAEAGGEPTVDRTSIMGFTGKSIESAQFILRYTEEQPEASRSELRQEALPLIDSCLRIRLSPPEVEGFKMDDGAPAMALPASGQVFLRSFTDDLASLLSAYDWENGRGRVHPEWVAWVRSFADWLIGQQTRQGGFPRSWKPGTGTVADGSLNNTANAVKVLVLLSQITGEREYLDSALRAGTFAWDHGQKDGLFVGGTIDNPDVLDKEGGTIPFKAYLMLYEATHDAAWLERARQAANYCETWIYAWSVPISPAPTGRTLPWDPGVPTTGFQLIATGHSLVDAYMAYSVGDYARLARYTGDPHYQEVALILLHNTKAMVALPGRMLGLREPGLQVEHWSFAPVRGQGLHRGWLPWVTCSQLYGIYDLVDFDPKLFGSMAVAEVPGPR